MSRYTMHIHSFIPEVSSVYTTHSKTNKGRIAHKKKEKKIKKKNKIAHACVQREDGKSQL
jgi:hypothetical protein